MVKKLFKHEMIYYVRSLLPMYIILCGISIIGRLIAILENESLTYSLIRGSSVFMLVISILTVLGLNLAFVIIRFYKNLFTGEGYLTLTLPITYNQHLIVKSVTAFITMVVSFIVSVISVCIFTVGDWLNEILKAGAYLYDKAAEKLSWHLDVYILQIFLLIMVVTATGILLYYMCISIGQCSRKNRILAAVGAYFAIYVVYQIISTFFSIIFTVVLATDLEEFFMNLSKDEIFTAVHIILLVVTVISAALAVVYFFVSKKILTKKLNLE